MTVISDKAGVLVTSNVIKDSG